MIEKKEIEGYYDKNVMNKLKDFLKGNKRVEAALKTIRDYSPENPQNILEIGCGIGYVSWYIKENWPESKVKGIDLSSESISMAKKLFGSERLEFEIVDITNKEIQDKYDMIILMDIYEHISPDKRDSVHKTIKKIIRKGGRIILTFPTPKHQKWLKDNDRELQPIDEDIAVEEINKFAKETDTKIMLYKEIDVWRKKDYAHAVLAKEDMKKYNKKEIELSSKEEKERLVREGLNNCQRMSWSVN
ncbi:class I SAM-dependent methyltransferase [Candidatus Woesearchaeota archaeon]|nr:class I SAM-dependent methyltransferase [Candidatus Woesearchaeota archaeon]